MKILLLEPSFYMPDGSLYHNRYHTVVALTLPHLAAYIDNIHSWEHELQIVYDRITSAIPEPGYDLVLISSFHCNGARANELADAYRALETPVVMGGYYPSLSPELALKHCDSVAIGAGEDLIPQILDDAKAKTLKRRYESTNRCPVKDLPMGRWDLIDSASVLPTTYWGVWATRGCTRGCDFCSMTSVYGRFHHKRPVNEVIEELKYRAGRWNHRRFFFVDDNIALDKAYAITLFRSLKDVPSKSILVNIDSEGAGDDEILDSAKEGGVDALYIGFETLHNIEENKGWGSLRQYADVLRKLRTRGIRSIASFMFGFDTDDVGVFRSTLAFVERHRVDVIFPFILTPIPGSALWERLTHKGRLPTIDKLMDDGEIMRGEACSFIPKNMTSKQLNRNYRALLRRFYGPWSIFWRCILHFDIRHPRKALETLVINLHFALLLVGNHTHIM